MNSIIDKNQIPDANPLEMGGLNAISGTIGAVLLNGVKDMQNVFGNMYRGLWGFIGNIFGRFGFRAEAISRITQEILDSAFQIVFTVGRETVLNVQQGLDPKGK